MLIASPEAASSQWVEKELAYWLDNRALSTLYIVVTAGELKWDDATRDFIWHADTPLPRLLRGRFAPSAQGLDDSALPEVAAPDQGDQRAERILGRRLREWAASNAITMFSL